MKAHDVRFKIKIKEMENLCEVMWYELCDICFSEKGKSHYNQKQHVLHVKHFVMLSITGDIYYFLLLCLKQ